MAEQISLEFKERKKYPEEISWFFRDENLAEKHVLSAIEKCLQKNRDWRGIKVGTRPFLRKIIELAAERLKVKVGDVDKLERDYHQYFFSFVSGVARQYLEKHKKTDPRDADFTGVKTQKAEDDVSKGRPFKGRSTKGAGRFIEKSQPN